MAAADRTAPVTHRIIVAAWFAILIAVFVEIALIIAAATFGKASDFRPFIADLAGKVSWSIMVCAGIAIGMAAGAVRTPAMGFLGLIAAPTGFTLAKAVHKSVAQGLDVAIAAATSGPTAAQMMTIRGLEYAVLGLAVGWISKKPWGGLPIYALLGFVIGGAAAAIVLMVTVRTSATPPPPLALISKGINEVLFPVGCAMVLCAVNALGQRMRLAVAAA